MSSYLYPHICSLLRLQGKSAAITLLLDVNSNRSSTFSNSDLASYDSLADVSVVPYVDGNCIPQDRLSLLLLAKEISVRIKARDANYKARKAQVLGDREDALFDDVEIALRNIDFCYSSKAVTDRTYVQKVASLVLKNARRGLKGLKPQRTQLSNINKNVADVCKFGFQLSAY
jgi:hypothetical protein